MSITRYQHNFPKKYFGNYFHPMYIIKQLKEGGSPKNNISLILIQIFGYYGNTPIRTM